MSSIYNESLERLERMIEPGFREGTMAQIKNLEDLLACDKNGNLTLEAQAE